MLVAIIWALVVVAAAFLAIGFFLTSSNIWLILAIVFAIAAIILVLGSWARRARETSASIFDETISFGGEEEGEGEEEELYSALDTDTAEEFAVGARRDRSSARRPAARKSGATPARKPKAKPKATKSKPKAKPAAKSTASRAKPAASKSTAKRKPAAKPAKAKPTSRPKAKPPRRRPQQ